MNVDLRLHMKFRMLGLGKRKQQLICEVETDAVSSMSPSSRKRLCTGVSSIPQDCSPHHAFQGQPDEGQGRPAPGDVTPPIQSHIIPVSPRRCYRCLAGEAGHFSHILK